MVKAFYYIVLLALCTICSSKPSLTQKSKGVIPTGTYRSSNSPTSAGNGTSSETPPCLAVDAGNGTVIKPVCRILSALLNQAMILALVQDVSKGPSCPTKTGTYTDCSTTFLSDVENLYVVTCMDSTCSTLPRYAKDNHFLTDDKGSKLYLRPFSPGSIPAANTTSTTASTGNSPSINTHLDSSNCYFLYNQLLDPIGCKSMADLSRGGAKFQFVADTGVFNYALQFTGSNIFGMSALLWDTDTNAGVSIFSVDAQYNLVSNTGQTKGKIMGFSSNNHLTIQDSDGGNYARMIPVQYNNQMYVKLRPGNSNSQTGEASMYFDGTLDPVLVPGIEGGLLFRMVVNQS